ncbi:MAG: hypothetical protein IJW51_04600 [Clostridia bacterium]|nr:hypothetical protein [Clostridia bacterium]
MTEHVKQRHLCAAKHPVPAWSVRFDPTSVSPDGVRCDLAVNMVAQVSMNNEKVRNDFDNVSIFQRPVFNATWDAEKRRWVDLVARGEEGFTFRPTESHREVVYRCTPFWYKMELDEVTGPTYISVSPIPLKGYRLAPMFKNGKSYVYRPCFEYAIGEDNYAHSRAGLVPFEQIPSVLTDRALRYDDKAHIETTEDWFSDYLLLLVEFATRNLHGVMNGKTYRALTCYTYATDSTDGLAGFYTEAPEDYEVGLPMRLSYTDAEGAAQSLDLTLKAIGERTARGCYLDLGIEDVKTLVANNSDFGLAYTVLKTGSALPYITNASSGVWGKLKQSPCVWRGKENPWGNIGSCICNVVFNVKNETGLGVHVLQDLTKFSKGINSEYFLKYDYGKTYMPEGMTEGYIVGFHPFVEDHILIPSSFQSEYPEHYWATYTEQRAKSSTGCNYLRVGGDFRTLSGVNHGTYQLLGTSDMRYVGGRLIVEEEL